MMKDTPRRVGVVFTGLLIATIGCLESSAAPRDEGAAVDRVVVAKRASKPQDRSKQDAKADESKGGAKPEQLGTFGDWGAYVAKGAKDKTCYALASPTDRAPSGLSRDPAFLFISTRPGEKVRDEVSFIVGFPMKASGVSKAEIGGTNFELVTKGSNAWIKNQADEPKFIETLKKGSKLVVKFTSTRGRVTTDTYSLKGVSQALEAVAKECP